jgi:hypothetical protein
MATKNCFVIAPIGEEGSSTRLRSDQILGHLIREVAIPLGYEVTRADEIAVPGIISNQVLERIVNDPLVIADLSERNPNVYYELAVRHAARKPVIQLVQKGEPLPFDIAMTRTITVDHKDLDSVADAKKDLARYIKNIEISDSSAIDSPISQALNFQAMRASGDPQRASIAEIAERMTGVHGSVVSIESTIEKGVFQRLDHLLRVADEIRRNTKVSSTGSADAVSKLGNSVEALRTKLEAAIDRLIQNIRGQHLELARKIQVVFEKQSESATLTVEHSFTEELARCMPLNGDRERLLKRLLEVFMDGMRAMGTFEQINVTKQTEAATQEIHSRITKSIKDVFQDIDKLEEQVLSLPAALPGLPGS